MEQNRQKPFFLYLPHFSVHMPLQARRQLIEHYQQKGAAEPTYAAMVHEADAAVGRVGVSWATEQCADLLHNGVRGIHFYTLNRSDATRQIYQNLGVTDSLGLRAG